MKWKPSAHKSDRVRLNLWDILRLLFGLVVQDSACKVGLWRWPR